MLFKAKFQMGQFKSLKQIFCKFVGQSDLEGQGQKFFRIVQDLKMTNTQLKFEVKISRVQKCCIRKESHKIF